MTRLVNANTADYIRNRVIFLEEEYLRRQGLKAEYWKVYSNIMNKRKYYAKLLGLTEEELIACL